MKLKINSVYEIGDKKFRLNEDLELIEITKSIYEFKENDEYYYINAYGDICYEKRTSHIVDGLLEIGNVFLTEEEARFELERRKTIAKIKKWKYENDDDYEFDASEYNYFVWYSFYSEKLIVEWVSYFKQSDNYLYFSSKEKAEKCLESIGEENWKKYIFSFK